MELHDPVSVYTLNDSAKAEIIKNFLQAEGIRCFLDGERSADLMVPAFAVRVMVQAADADRASKLIESHEARHKK